MSEHEEPNNEQQITLGMEEILSINQQIKGVLSDLHLKQTTLSKIYGDLVKENQSKLYLFGLDSLQFQSQMIKVEHTNLEKFHKIIRNRLYGDFFKLYHIVKSFIKEDPKLSELLDTRQWGKYPQYKDLQVEAPFEISYVKRIFEDIMEMIELMKGHITALDKQLNQHTQQMSGGLNIDNFIFTFQSCNKTIHNRIDLFVKYVQYLIKSYKYYLMRFYKRAVILNGHIGEDLTFYTSGKIPPEKTINVDMGIGKNKTGTHKGKNINSNTTD